MKKRFAFAAAILSTAGLVLPSFAASTNGLIYNGDFESGVSAPAGGYTTVNGPSYDISYWYVSGTSVDVVNSAYGAISGNSIDLLGTPGPGSIATTFYAGAVRPYELKFDLFRNGSTGAVDVFFGDHTSRFFSTSSSPVTYSMLFNPSQIGGYNLRFSSVTIDNLYSGAVIDNVSVMAAVPEPKTYVMLLAGLSMVGFAVRRRKASRF